jgi:antitoxin component YwqK of YwqJK toxin-antitoxin module
MWFNNGQLNIKSNYKDGKLNGLFKTWYPNGQLRLKRYFINGKPKGLWQEWDNNGNLIAEIMHNTEDEEKKS